MDIPRLSGPFRLPHQHILQGLKIPRQHGFYSRLLSKVAKKKIIYLIETLNLLDTDSTQSRTNNKANPRKPHIDLVDLAPSFRNLRQRLSNRLQPLSLVFTTATSFVATHNLNQRRNKYHIPPNTSYTTKDRTTTVTKERGFNTFSTTQNCTTRTSEGLNSSYWCLR